MNKEKLQNIIFVNTTHANMGWIMECVEKYASQQSAELQAKVEGLERERNELTRQAMNIETANTLKAGEIERLRGLIEEMFRSFRDVDTADVKWQQFKTDNNL